MSCFAVVERQRSVVVRPLDCDRTPVIKNEVATTAVVQPAEQVRHYTTFGGIPGKHGGNFPDVAVNGKLYGRQDEGWVELGSAALADEDDFYTPKGTEQIIQKRLQVAALGATEQEFFDSPYYSGAEVMRVVGKSHTTHCIAVIANIGEAGRAGLHLVTLDNVLQIVTASSDSGVYPNNTIFDAVNGGMALIARGGDIRFSTEFANDLSKWGLRVTKDQTVQLAPRTTAQLSSARDSPEGAMAYNVSTHELKVNYGAGFENLRVAWADVTGKPTHPTIVTVNTPHSTRVKVGTSVSGGLATPSFGDRILVDFTDGCSAGSPELEIDGGDPYPITVGVAPVTTLLFSSIVQIYVEMWFNGTSWQLSEGMQRPQPAEISEAEILDGVATTTRSISGRRVALILDRNNHTGTQTLSTISDAGTAAAKNVPTSGNASASEVVLGDDTRFVQLVRSTSTTLAKGSFHHIDANVTIPTLANGAPPVGSIIPIYLSSSTERDITPGVGVTLRHSGTSDTGVATIAEYGSVTLSHVNTNEWRISGDLV